MECRTIRAVAIAIFCFAFPLLAQEKAATTSWDFSSAKRLLLYDPAFPLGKTSLLLPPSFDFRGVRLGTPYLMPLTSGGPLFGAGVDEQPVDLMASFRFQLDRQQRMQPLMKWLGAVQAGATAYIAYRHIKKFGFLK